MNESVSPESGAEFAPELDHLSGVGKVPPDTTLTTAQPAPNQDALLLVWGREQGEGLCVSPSTDVALWAAFDHPIHPCPEAASTPPALLAKKLFFPGGLLILLRMKATGLQGGRGRLSVHDRK